LKREALILAFSKRLDWLANRIGGVWKKRCGDAAIRQG